MLLEELEKEHEFKLAQDGEDIKEIIKKRLDGGISLNVLSAQSAMIAFKV